MKKLDKMIKDLSERIVSMCQTVQNDLSLFDTEHYAKDLTSNVFKSVDRLQVLVGLLSEWRILKLLQKQLPKPKSKEKKE